MDNGLEELRQLCTTVLEDNHKGTHTVPTNSGLYPHQWLWDSCFVAIGLRHYDVDRAQAEIMRLFDAQWHNGMVPNMVFASEYSSRDGNIWRSWVNPNAPEHVQTSGITQPPMLAEAIVRIGEKLTTPERHTWYKQTYPHLLAFHQWLYRERDPHNEGLVLQVHPWETGLDNTPPWMSELHEHQMPLWIQTIKKLKLGSAFNLLRRDTRYIPAAQRLDIIDALGLFSTQRRLRRKRYDIDKILSHSLFAIEDVNFNAIFLRANDHLQAIAADIKKELPADLLADIQRSKSAFEQLWDPYSSQYYSREFVSHHLIKIPSIGALVTLYSGSISKNNAEHLVKLLEDPNQFGANYAVPSVPLSSEWFKPLGYWQGPTWVNTNWLIIDGLKRYGYHDHAAALLETTLEMVARSGPSEYFSPLDGSAAGAENFSWTAALTIDLIEQSELAVEDQSSSTEGLSSNNASAPTDSPAIL